MNEKRIAEIVRKVYAKAKKSCVSEAKSALANHVEDEIFKKHKKSISFKTIERAFDKYIDGKSVGSPVAESVDLLCQFLGYKNYADYVNQNKKKKWVSTISIGITLGVVLLLAPILKKQLSNGQTLPPNQCMAWADTLYVEVSCATKPYSKYGTSVEPLDKMKLENFKKVKVDMATQFFAEKTNKPLIWYYKNKDGEIEYFTAPGLHPINGETLRKITPYIIQTYVPEHIDRKGSFVP